MNKKEYYNIMVNMEDVFDFKTLYSKWKKCFIYILVSIFKFKKQSAIKLFYNFDMENWTALHIENTEYKNYSKNELIEAFVNECDYISDRISYDRLFRTHWLFKQSFDKEFNEIKYSNLYKNNKGEN